MTASFAPTLSMLAAAGELEASGYTVAEAERQLRNFFSAVDLRSNVEFTGERMRVIATGEILEKFSAMITAKFFRGDVPFLMLATGDVVEVTVEVG